MFRAKTVDELYSEVSGCSLVITNDAALATALNARVDRPMVGYFAVTPRNIARMSAVEVLGEPLMNDIRLVSEISADTGIEFRKVHGELLNIREIRKHTADVRKHLATRSARKVYDSFESLPTVERVMSRFDPSKSSVFNSRPGDIAVIGIDFFDDLDKHFIPDDFIDVDVFDRGSDYSIGEIFEVGNDRQIAENVVDLIDASNCNDCAIVLSASSPIADSVRSALYKKGIAFVNRFEVRDLAQIRDYLQFVTLSLSYETLRVKHVREIFANYNGFFKDGTDEYLLSKMDGSYFRHRAADLRGVMEGIRGLTFDEVREGICDRRARIQVGIVLDDLGISGRKVTTDLVSNLNYAVDKISSLHHNEEIPVEEKTGVLIADCSESICVDRPLVFFLNMDHDWDVSTAGKPYIDAETENERNVDRMTAVLQQGDRRLYMVNTTKKGKPARPAMAFDMIVGRPAKGFGDVCARLTPGRWAEETREVRQDMGVDRLENVEEVVKGFSKTGFNSFYSCPRMFMFYKILPSSEEKNTEMGTLIHEFAQLYACYPDVVREVGLGRLVDMVSDRYSGLSAPLMKGVDQDKISCAMRNVARYIDRRLGEDIPLDRPPDKERNNRFFDMFGLEYWSSRSESAAKSRKHPLYGVFDAVSDSLVIDYKTGKA
ncbi:MAG: PD-(D/E)XK nuclease family protein, partial [Candidatus Methanomethylophilaceae archaeon]|nr:PD-(D/E)XK nuclease family protein [Candidatus Methanomethylophilaceae archaeon]